MQHVKALFLGAILTSGFSPETIPLIVVGTLESRFVRTPEAYFLDIDGEAFSISSSSLSKSGCPPALGSIDEAEELNDEVGWGFSFSDSFDKVEDLRSSKSPHSLKSCSFKLLRRP